MRIWIHVALMLGPPAIASLAIVTWGGDASAKEEPVVVEDQAVAALDEEPCDQSCASLPQDFVPACVAESP
jgi:hypothetical protein